eukprot:TRINITY_DN4564_c0_g1_i4.p5 TRINITY_DN4564_c0_g1~~TRINITY_DN4564_c0_g1_i4.p5  ORF type:complete len:101 (-),score=15.67 TRINITY_DN4564_c0_g1_i4:40-342(-)
MCFAGLFVAKTGVQVNMTIMGYIAGADLQTGDGFIGSYRLYAVNFFVGVLQKMEIKVVLSKRLIGFYCCFLECINRLWQIVEKKNFLKKKKKKKIGKTHV